MSAADLKNELDTVKSEPVDVKKQLAVYQAGPNDLEAVKHELEDVKKQLAVFQAGTRDSSKKDQDGTTAKNFRFLDLSRELRDAIYELCVVPGKVFIYHANSIKTYDMRITPITAPNVKIFQVCKQIHEEARDLFIKKNLLVLTSGPCTTLPTLRKFLNSVDTEKLCRLSLSFDYRDYAAIGVSDFVTRHFRATERPGGFCDEDFRSMMVNVMQHQTISELWYPLLTTIRHINLDYLQVNVQNWYDTSGTVHQPEEYFGREFSPVTKHRRAGLIDNKNKSNIFEALKKLPVKVVDIIGTTHSTQRSYLRYKLDGGPGELQFHAGKHRVNELQNYEWDEEEAVVEDKSRKCFWDTLLSEDRVRKAKDEESAAESGD